MRVMVGDCRDVLPTLTERSFDLMVTSPPYNAGKEYETSLTRRSYEALASSWVRCFPRLIAPEGSLWINLGYMIVGVNRTIPLTHLFLPLIERGGLELVQEVVWQYAGGMAYKRRFTHRTERWLWFAHPGAGPYFDLDAVRDPSLNKTSDERNNPLGKNPTDCWFFPRVAAGSREKALAGHPCPFPERMIERIVRACCPAGGRVVDPFAGSCTVGRVCDRLGIESVCIEANRAYVPETDPMFRGF